jgi:transposase-like protein
MAMEIQERDSRFRVVWQDFSMDWIPDTPTNKKALLVFLRSLLDDKDKHIFTFQELSVLFNSNNRQASSQHMEDFWESGCDFLSYLTRKRKVDCVVVESVRQELMRDPLAKLVELQERVNARLGGRNLTSANIKAALEQIPYDQIRDVIISQLSHGKAHYQEEYLLTEMMESNNAVAERAGIQIPESEGMVISDPSSIRSLVTPDIPTSSVKDSLRWVVLCMILYFYGVPLSVLGSWLHVHKTTVLRWMIGLAVELFPLVYVWIIEKVKARVVYIDEKWLKLRGKWHYWFVVLDSETGIPVLASLLGARSRWSCRGCKLKQLGKQPGVIITDGLSSYHELANMMGAKHVLSKHVLSKHVLCHFHHQQGVTRWLKKHLGNADQDKAQIDSRKKEMKRILQTDDKRTVRRRFARLKESSDALGIKEWVDQTEVILPKLLPSVGSKRIPKTTNAIERFFRAFNRFYKTRCGFFTVTSAKRELILFLLLYVFIRQPESGKAPIESIMPEANRMPLYQLINDPFGTVLGVKNVKKNARMADFPLKECIAA